MMDKTTQKIGFTYFSAPEFMIRSRIETWFPQLRRWGASYVILESRFDRAIPEDVFQTAHDNRLEPIVHFTGELPLARVFNDLTTVLDAYARWGVQYVILGDRPNIKAAWPVAGWHYENLVDHFLDRFIPLANYVERLGLCPIFPPLQPGGDYWDTAFVELSLKGLKRRQMDSLLDRLCLASYGVTFDRPLSWGAGGPERWATSKPYLTPEGQQDQLGFQNFEWVQAAAQKALGRAYPVLILDAGNPGRALSQANGDHQIAAVQMILAAARGKAAVAPAEKEAYPIFNGSVLACTFSLDTLKSMLGGDFSFENLQTLFRPGGPAIQAEGKTVHSEKPIRHYLLLPRYESGVSDVVLNKVRPVIKRYQPTVGFELGEAMLAEKVFIFPDSTLFPDEDIQRLRAAGCAVEMLPPTGIEIATFLQGTSFNTERS